MDGMVQHTNWRHALAMAAVWLVIAADASLCRADDPPPITPQANYNPAEAKIDVTWTRCLIGKEPSTCPTTYAIYRTPGPATPAPEVLTGLELANRAVTWSDETAQPGNSYTYLVCTGTAKEDKQSNCAVTLPVSYPAPSPPAPSGATCDSYTGFPCRSAFSPPLSVQATTFGDVVALQWNNNTSQQSYPPDRVQINSNQGDPNAFEDVLISLPATSTRSSFSAKGGPGTLNPHSTTTFQVCEGIGYIFSSPQTNCAASNPVNVGGLDPVLFVGADGNNSATLKVLVDNPANLSTIDVTRQESDDPARQGTTLGNGLKGCLLPSPVPGSGLKCVNTSVFHLDVTQRSPDATGSLVKSYALGVDSNLKPGVTYYYTATATWFSSSMSQASEVTTFTDPLVLIVPHKKSGGPPVAPDSVGKLETAKKIPSGSLKMQDQTQNGTKQAVLKRTVSKAISLRLTRAMPGSAQDLLSRAQSFCSAQMPDVCANVLYMALIRAQATNDSVTEGAVKQALSARGLPTNLP